MKKTTFKSVLTLLVCIMGLQTFAQVLPNTPYRLRTAIPAQEDYNGNDTPFPGQFLYPTASAGSDALSLQPKEGAMDTDQLFEFKPVTGVTFNYPIGSTTSYQVYNVVTVNAASGNGTGVLERNNLTSDGQRMRLRGAAYPQNGNLFNFIVVPFAVSDANFNEPNAYVLISTYGTDAAPEDLRFMNATTNFDWLNYGGPLLANAPAWLSSFVIETAGGTVVLSNAEFDTSSIFISNPVKNELNIKGLTSNVKQVSVYSLLGQEVLTRKVDAQSFLNIDVSTLKSGIYLVEMKGETGAFVKKIVKE